MSDPSTWLAWCGTWLVHSTVILGAAWIAARMLRPGAAVRDAMWKCALVLPIVTAALQLAMPDRSVAPRLAVVQGDVVPALPAELPWPRELRWQDSSRRTDPLAASTFDVEPAVVGPSFDPRWVVLGLALVWCALVVLVPAARLSWLLRKRIEVDDLDAVREFDRILARSCIRRGIRFTVSDRVDSPIAFGVFAPEVCVPWRALDLAPDLLRALIAHELAHHARFDPLWTRATHAVVGLGWMQPLQRIARRELARTAELLADDLALSWTSDRAGLAQCLAEVTGWLPRRRVMPGAAAIPMVQRSGRSPLRERVERVLDGTTERRARRALLAAAVVGGVVALAAPGIGTGIEAPADADADVGVDTPPGALDALAREVDALRAELFDLEIHTHPSIRADARALRERLVDLEARRRRLASTDDARIDPLLTLTHRTPLSR